MASTVYPIYHSGDMVGKYDLTSGNVWVMLVSGYSYSSSHQHVSDVSANEVPTAGTNYSRVTLANPTVFLTGVTGVFDADDVTWANSTIDSNGAILFYSGSGGTDATNDLIAHFGFNQAQSNNGNFTLQWSASGILRRS
ncbi:MAG: hypothetical protein D6732_14125 [Methanobacteriota archaeon]|nr:MAG: hypothetical protein D6732_14125 [Euryarchaeota archaeon]